MLMSVSIARNLIIIYKINWVWLNWKRIITMDAFSRDRFSLHGSWVVAYSMEIPTEYNNLFNPARSNWLCERFEMPHFVVTLRTQTFGLNNKSNIRFNTSHHITEQMSTKWIHWIYRNNSAN